jgi:hypothetical protein
MNRGENRIAGRKPHGPFRADGEITAITDRKPHGFMRFSQEAKRVFFLRKEREERDNRINRIPTRPRVKNASARATREFMRLFGFLPQGCNLGVVFEISQA